MNPEDLARLLAELRLISAAQEEHGKDWILAFSEGGKQLLAELAELRNRHRGLQDLRSAIESVGNEVAEIRAALLDSTHSLQAIVHESSVTISESLQGTMHNVAQVSAEAQARVAHILSDGETGVCDAIGHGQTEAVNLLQTVAAHLDKTRSSCDQIRSIANASVGKIAEPLDQIERIVAPIKPILAVLEELL